MKIILNVSATLPEQSTVYLIFSLLRQSLETGNLQSSLWLTVLFTIPIIFFLSGFCSEQFNVPTYWGINYVGNLSRTMIPLCSLGSFTSNLAFEMFHLYSFRAVWTYIYILQKTSHKCNPKASSKAIRP